MSNEHYTAKEMVEAIKAEDGVVRDVADRLGCSRMTVYRYRKRYKTVSDALEKQRTDLVYEMRDRAKDMARDEDVSDAVQWDAILKLLKVFDDEYDWAERRRTDITSGGEQINAVTLNVVETDAEDFENEVRPTPQANGKANGKA